MAVLLFCAVSHGRDAPRQVSATMIDPVFSTNLQHAVEAHPLVVAAKLREQAAGYDDDALVFDFSSPLWAADAGYARGPNDVPGVSLGRIAAADAVAFSGGVEAPVGGGLYAGAGVAERVLTGTSDGEDLRQTAVGARARLPLLRDFKYGLHQRARMQRLAEVFSARAERIERQHAVARDALLAWTALLRALADLQAVERAVTRAEQLFEQTSARAELKDVAAYQVFATKYEVAMRREELQEARQNLESGVETLRERLGLHAPPGAGGDRPPVVGGTNDMLTVARSFATLRDTVFSARDVLRHHPRCMLNWAMEEQAAAELAMEMERAKDAVDVTAGIGWRGETASGLFGDDAVQTHRNEVVEVGISWRRSLDKRGARTAVAAARTRLSAARADRRAVENEVLAALSRAHTVFASACGRLQLAASAIEEAGKTLEAESSRFSLGEGTSRNVLDAQKDLTTATRRGVAVSATVVSAWVELIHAAGRNPAACLISSHSFDAADGVGQKEE